MSARRMRRGSNWSGRIKPGRVVHGDLGAEASVAEVGPVTDLAVADAHNISEAVAGQVGQGNRLGAVGEYDARAALLVRHGPEPSRRTESFLRQRRIPSDGEILGDQHVGVAVAGEIDESQIRVVPGQIGKGSEGAERLPILVCRCVRKIRSAGRSSSTTSTRPSPAKSRNRAAGMFPPGMRATGSIGAKRVEYSSVAAIPGKGRFIAFIEPSAALLGEDARKPFAVQIHPLVGGTIHAIGEVFHADRDRHRGFFGR